MCQIKGRLHPRGGSHDIHGNNALKVSMRAGLGGIPLLKSIGEMKVASTVDTETVGEQLKARKGAIGRPKGAKDKKKRKVGSKRMNIKTTSTNKRVVATLHSVPMLSKRGASSKLISGKDKIKRTVSGLNLSKKKTISAVAKPKKARKANPLGNRKNLALAHSFANSAGIDSRTVIGAVKSKTGGLSVTYHNGIGKPTKTHYSAAQVKRQSKYVDKSSLSTIKEKTAKQAAEAKTSRRDYLGAKRKQSGTTKRRKKSSLADWNVTIF